MNKQKENNYRIVKIEYSCEKSNAVLIGNYKILNKDESKQKKTVNCKIDALKGWKFKKN